IVTNIVLVTALHKPLPVVANVNVTLPAAISVADGTYWAFNVVALGVNDPLPELVHFPPPALVIVPLSCTLPASAHIVWPGPALTVGAAFIVTVNPLLTALHAPFPCEVRVNVTVPLVISVADGTYLAFNVAALRKKLPVPDVVHNPPAALVTVPLR